MSEEAHMFGGEPDLFLNFVKEHKKNWSDDGVCWRIGLWLTCLAKDQFFNLRRKWRNCKVEKAFVKTEKNVWVHLVNYGGEHLKKKSKHFLNFATTAIATTATITAVSAYTFSRTDSTIRTSRAGKKCANCGRAEKDQKKTTVEHVDRMQKMKRSMSDISDDNIKCAIIMGLCPDIKLHQEPMNTEQVIRAAKLTEQVSLATEETESSTAAAIPRIETRRLLETYHRRSTFGKAKTADTNRATPVSTVRMMSETIEIHRDTRNQCWDRDREVISNRRIEHVPKHESSSETNIPQEWTFLKNKHFLKNENFRK